MDVSRDTILGVKPTIFIVLSLALLTPTAARADGPTTQPHTLPTDATAPVITLDRKGGMILRKNQQPWFQVLADGTAIAGDPFGWGREVKGKLSADQLQELLHFILDDEKFDDINDGDLDWPPGVEMSDATTTTISVDAGGTDHSCGGRAVEALPASRTSGTPAARFVAVAHRLDQVRNIVALGGDDAVKKLLSAANAKLKADLPDEPPMTADDITRAQPNADAGANVTLARKTVMAGGKWHMTQADVTDDGKGQVTVKVEKGADQEGVK